jgi:hypothetical protein
MKSTPPSQESEMDKPIPEAVQSPVKSVRDAAQYLIRYPGDDYAQRHLLERIDQLEARLTAAQQQGQAVAFDIERARTLADYVVGYARAVELKSLSSDACVALRDLHAMLHAQPMQQGGGDVAMEAWNAALNDAGELRSNAPDERYARRAANVESWIKSNRPAPPSAPVGVEAALRDALQLLIDFIELDKLAMDADALFIAKRAIAQQPAAVDGAYPTPRNRAEAVALARLALAHLGVIDAHIDAAIARCETDLATQHQEPTT